MKPTEEQIEDFAEQFLKPGQVNNDVIKEASIKSAQWAISQMQPEWVAINSASDLPDKYGHVLIYGRFTKDCPKNVCIALYNPKTRKFYSDGIQSKDVTHWMPLPQPPKDINQ